jgi:hypothetical protein
MNYIRTWREHDVHLGPARASSIDIRDIAHHLAAMARFNGATEMPYSVAQHAVVVARILAIKRAPAWLQMLGLLHDAHEAYLGDITSPMRREIARRAGRDVVAEIAAELDTVIFARFRLLPFNQAARKSVETADRQAFVTEWAYLMPGLCPDRHPPAAMSIKPWPRDKAEKVFLDTFHMLEKDMGPYPGHVPAGIVK